VSSLAEVRLWGSTVGAVALEETGGTAVFQYDAAFADSGIELAPLTMPLRREPYAFAGLAHESFHGLPGLLADSLPDRFGNAVIDAWLARQGRTPDSFDAVERLCYTGTRGMGALEFAPARGPRESVVREIEVGRLVELAAAVLSDRDALAGSLDGDGREAALTDMLRVGTSAGGARPKAVIAWNPETDAIRSGQVHAGDGFEQWLLKFDGVSGSGDKGLRDPQGYGAIEYAYALMATAAGIEMSPCRLLEENGRRHFMTRRFDRTADGGKLHMQSLGALCHFDYNLAGAHSYEQALLAIRRLELPIAAVEEQFRRMAFNVVARNQDDHVKNVAFLMDRDGRWRLAPAFDVTYAWEPGHRWVGSHQMSVNGKREGFVFDDLAAVARGASMARGRAREIVAEVTAAVARWREFATAAGVREADAERIAAAHRLELAAA